jgi:CheY-like chemotaxis protein
MKPKCILLVDDSPEDRELALDALEQNNLANEVTVLRDGVEALDYMFRRGEFSGREDRDPAVILLDLKMPRLDGLEVLRELKGEPRFKNIPVVMMTSSREDRDLEACYALGVNAYVVKPLDFHEFVDAVKIVGMFWLALNESPQTRRSR